MRALLLAALLAVTACAAPGPARLEEGRASRPYPQDIEQCAAQPELGWCRGPR